MCRVLGRSNKRGLRVGAARVVNFWKMPPKHALALGKQKILRF
jgi:hypothetical protein